MPLTPASLRGKEMVPQHMKQPLWLKRLIKRLTVQVIYGYARFAGRHGMTAMARHGDRLGRLHYLLSPLHRRRLGRQIARLLEEKPSSPRITAILRDSYRISDRAIVEVMAFSAGVVTADELASATTVTGAEALAEVLESGSGAILLGMHMGNVFAFLSELDRRGLPISVIAYQSRKLPDGFFEDMVAHTDMETIQARPERAAYYALSKALKRGRATFIPVDQIHKSGGVETIFLGKRVNMPGGPVALARKLGVPIFPVFLDAADPEWKFSIGEPVRLNGERSLEEDMTDVAAILDRYIRAHPELWSWHQRRWYRYAFAADV